MPATMSHFGDQSEILQGYVGSQSEFTGNSNTLSLKSSVTEDMSGGRIVAKGAALPRDEVWLTEQINHQNADTINQFNEHMQSLADFSANATPTQVAILGKCHSIFVDVHSKLVRVFKKFSGRDKQRLMIYMNGWICLLLSAIDVYINPSRHVDTSLQDLWSERFMILVKLPTAKKLSGYECDCQRKTIDVVRFETPGERLTCSEGFIGRIEVHLSEHVQAKWDLHVSQVLWQAPRRSGRSGSNRKGVDNRRKVTPRILRAKER